MTSCSIEHVESLNHSETLVPIVSISYSVRHAYSSRPCEILREGHACFFPSPRCCFTAVPVINGYFVARSNCCAASKTPEANGNEIARTVLSHNVGLVGSDFALDAVQVAQSAIAPATALCKERPA